MKYVIILSLALTITACAKNEPIEKEQNMSINIQSFAYPANTPSENGYSYMCFGVNGETSFADYRDWISDAWVLNEGDTVQSFIEVGRKLIE